MTRAVIPFLFWVDTDQIAVACLCEVVTLTSREIPPPRCKLEIQKKFCGRH